MIEECEVGKKFHNLICSPIPKAKTDHSIEEPNPLDWIWAWRSLCHCQWDRILWTILILESCSEIRIVCQMAKAKSSIPDPSSWREILKFHFTFFFRIQKFNTAFSGSKRKTSVKCGFRKIQRCWKSRKIRFFADNAVEWRSLCCEKS